MASPEGALQLPLSTKAPGAEALLGYGRGDTLRLVERLSRRAQQDSTVTRQAHAGVQHWLHWMSHVPTHDGGLLVVSTHAEATKVAPHCHDVPRRNSAHRDILVLG